MVALVIIYNHRFDKNIARLEDIYGDRFSHIFHLVPFYDGNKENVIPVYENSYYFQAYISQGYNILKGKGDFDHFLFIGDDLLLHPDIDENSYETHFKLTKKTSFFPFFTDVAKEVKWLRSRKAFSFSAKQPGLEAEKELPRKDEILKQFKKHNIETPFIVRPRGFKAYLYYLKYKIKTKQFFNLNKVYLDFPIVMGYSDLLIIDKHSMPGFVHNCGVFSAGKLFVEIAIPTAMIMACEDIQTQENTEKKALILWKKEREVFENKYEKSLGNLHSNFPDNISFIHPVKLSLWGK